MSVARKIAYNAVVNAIAKVLSTVLALIAIGFITRYLGAEGFGAYTLALTFFSLFGALADFGLYSVATREISRTGADERRILGNVFSLRLVISSSVLVLAGLLVGFLPYEESVKVAIMLSGMAFLFSSSYSVLNGIFQKNLVMDRVAIIELGGKVLQVGLVIGAVWYDLGFMAIMGAFVLNMVFNFIGVFWASRKYVAFPLFLFEKKYAQGFLRASLPVGVSAIVTFLYFKLDAILLSLYQNTEAVGIYGGAYKVIENMVFFPAMIIGLVLPLLSRFIYQDPKKFQTLANKVFKLFVVLVLPLMVGVWFTATDIMLLIGGEAFLPSVPVLQVLVIALACMFFGNLFNAILLAGGKQRQLMYILTFCAALNITLNVIVIPVYSYMGAAFTSAVTEFSVALLGFWLTTSLLGYVPKFSRVWGAFLSVVLMGIFLFLFLDVLGFFLSVPLAAMIYFVGAIWTKSIQKKELVQLFAR